MCGRRPAVWWCSRLADVVADGLSQRWSPQQISRHLRTTYPHDRAMRLCHESIHQAPRQGLLLGQRPARRSKPACSPGIPFPARDRNTHPAWMNREIESATQLLEKLGPFSNSNKVRSVAAIAKTREF